MKKVLRFLWLFGLGLFVGVFLVLILENPNSRLFFEIIFIWLAVLAIDGGCKEKYKERKKKVDK